MTRAPHFTNRGPIPLKRQTSRVPGLTPRSGAAAMVSKTGSILETLVLSTKDLRSGCGLQRLVAAGPFEPAAEVRAQAAILMRLSYGRRSSVASKPGRGRIADGPG